jgi:hypothetical protein
MRRLVHATSFLLMLGLAGPANALPRPDRELVRARLGGSADATFTRDGSRLTGLTRLSVQTTGDSPRTRATSFVKAHRDLLSLGDKDSVEAIEVKALPRLTGPARPSQVVRLRQLHRDLPVEGRELVVTLDGSDRVIAVRSDVGALDVPTPGHELSAARKGHPCQWFGGTYRLAGARLGAAAFGFCDRLDRHRRWPRAARSQGRP